MVGLKGRKIPFKSRPASPATIAHLNRCRKKLGPGVAASNALFNAYKSVGRKRGHSWGLSKEEFLILTKKECFYCGSSPLGKKRSQDNSGDYDYNGIDRVDNNLGYTTSNSVTCCKICNIAKNSQSLEDFKSWINRVNTRINK